MSKNMKLKNHNEKSFPKLLSLIIPLKNEKENIKVLYDEICKSLKDYNFELIYIDDGSNDGTFEELKNLYEKDKRVKVVSFKINYGKASAYTAGFIEAKGDLIATLDGDLQDDPADLPMLISKLKNEEYDLIIGRKKTGKSSFITLLLSKLFNFLIRVISGLKVHDMNCPMRVMRTEVALKLNIYGGLFRYIPLIAMHQGYSVSEIEIKNRERIYGKSNFTGKKYIKSFFDFITAFFLTKYSDRPLHVFGSIGIFSFAIGFLIDFYLTIGFIFFEFSIKNNVGSLLFGILLIILGVQLISTGLIGEMLNHNKILDPNNLRYIIKKYLSHDK